MLKIPRLKYSYTAQFLDDENVLLASEKDNSLLAGKLHRSVLWEIAEKGIPVDQLVTKLEGTVSPFEVLFVLHDLENKGYLTEDVPSLPPETCAYWNSLGIDAGSLLETLRKKDVIIKVIGALSPEPFQQAFEAAGINVRLASADQTTQSATAVGEAHDVREEADLTVIITDDYGREELKQINRDAQVSRLPWMLLKPSGVEIWVGPIFIPGKTGCWDCLKQRLTINRPIDTFYRAQKKTAENIAIPTAYLPQTIQVAAGQAALEIAQWLYWQTGNHPESNSPGSNRLEGNVLTYDTPTMAGASHQLVKRPQCKTCGEARYRNPEPRPIKLEKTAAHCAAANGGYRQVSPEETVEKYRRHVSPVTGIVQWLKPYYSIKDTPVYNYSSGHNMALKSKTLYWLNEHIRSGSGGKGKTWAQARAGALCEAIERYSLMYHGDEPYICASLKGLGSEGIHPNRCMNYSDTQYRDRETLNRECAKFYSIIPVPFEPAMEMDWTPVYSLTEETFKYLPSCFCYAQYPAKDESTLFSYPDSNGCAAGNTVAEAILQGFLEVVERDSVAMWWYNRLRKPAVDLGSFDEPYFLRLIDYYRSMNRSLYVLDITADLGIPSFAAVSHRLDDPVKENIVFGFGAHVDAKIGIERALVELNQLLPLANVSEDERARGQYRTMDKAFVHWLETATMENQPYLKPMEEEPPKNHLKNPSHYPQLCRPDIHDSLNFCIGQAEEQSLETLVLDMTRPDVGLNVVRVFLPGMRHFWKRLAPGRLYDVPVKMGWLPKPLDEKEMNPVGLFI